MNTAFIFRKLLPLLGLAAGGLLIICTPFAADPLMQNGFIAAKANWFLEMTVLFALAAAYAACMGVRPRLSFTWADGLVCGLTAVTLLTYDWSLRPEPEKLRMGASLVALWFTMRYALGSYPYLRLFFIVCLMCTGLLEALYGFAQLYGYAARNHPLFALTGSFFNPGPYSGYLAALLPLCLGMLLRAGRLCKRRSGGVAGRLYLFSWLCFLSIACILPAGMSRSAWLAALAGCGWVYGAERAGWKKTSDWIRRHRMRAWLGAGVIGILLAAGALSLYHLKKDSADGRILMWKLTATAILQHPLRGTGLGGFPAAYAETQADYFASGEKPAAEQRVAGCPEYAFNEYLQIGLEEGIPGICLFAGWMGCCFWSGLKRKQHAVCGGLIALAVFAFSSYPLQLPSFWVVWIILSAYTPRPSSGKEKGGRRWIAVLWAMTAVSLVAAWEGKAIATDYRQWATARMLYENRAYEKAIVSYRALFPRLKHKPDFLFEGAQCLRKTGRPAEAIGWLQRAVRLSADPMLYYVMAQNEQALGRYPEAERHLRYAIAILPDRIYPYYLLAKLYAEPAFFQPEKMQQAARVVMWQKPKVENTAIREMREELKKNAIYKEE